MTDLHPSTPEAPRTVRVTLRYGAAAAEIVEAVPIQGPIPSSDWRPGKDSAGAWLEVLDPKGKVAFARPLTDPQAGREVFTAEDSLERRRRSRPMLHAAVEVPWVGEGTRIALHVRTGREGKGAPSLVALLALEPSWISFEGTKFPMFTYPRWGHANPRALSLVFMPEAFTAAELPGFGPAVEAVLNAFETTEPFQSLLPALKAVRIDIPSKESGIRPSKHNTYFKGRFTVPRVIEVDQGIAARVLNDHVRTSARALVMANTATYGGSGGAAVVFSREANWSNEIAIHELGHGHFNLADEYSAAGQAATMEPVERNVSKFFDRARLKWAAQVAATTPLPTQPFGAPPPAGLPLGAYEGGKYKERGIWRPAFDCKMRTPGQPFCAVCRGVIAEMLAPHMP